MTGLVFYHVDCIYVSSTNVKKILAVRSKMYGFSSHEKEFVSPLSPQSSLTGLTAMGSVAALAPIGAVAISRLPNICSSRRKKKKNVLFRAKLNNDGDEDPLLQVAIKGASLRFQETHRPEPLFLDPYAGCFITPDVQKDMKQSLMPKASSTCPYCLATKFIDDKLISTMNHMDELRQIVLLTDGMDTRPYRLKWPNSTIIFDVSPESVFRTAAQELKGVGAKIPRSRLLVHVPSDSSNMQEILCRKGFNGSRPSIWALQGLPMMNLSSFKEIIVLVSSLAMKGCMFLGELPMGLLETEAAMEGIEHPNMQHWMDKFFMSNGLRVNVISFDEIARNVDRDPPSGNHSNIMFVAEQLRLSDDQMESWRSEFQRVEEEGDEEGFEEP